MTFTYPIVFEAEDSGAVSAYVPDLRLYAAADTHAATERAIQNLPRALVADLIRRDRRLPRRACT